MSNYVDATQAARLCGVNPRTITRWIAKGKIEATKDRLGNWAIKTTDLADYIPPPLSNDNTTIYPPPWDKAPDILTAVHAAGLLGVTYHTITRWIRRGKLAGTKKNERHYVILKSEAYKLSDHYYKAQLESMNT